MFELINRDSAKSENWRNCIAGVTRFQPLSLRLEFEFAASTSLNGNNSGSEYPRKAGGNARILFHYLKPSACPPQISLFPRKGRFYLEENKPLLRWNYRFAFQPTNKRFDRIEEYSFLTKTTTRGFEERRWRERRRRKVNFVEDVRHEERSMGGGRVEEGREIRCPGRLKNF